MTIANGIDKIYEIMELTREVTDADIREVQDMINNQVNYTHPLRRAEMSKIRQIGKHNREMLSKFTELKVIVDKWEENNE